jgi:hypothetical protein
LTRSLTSKLAQRFSYDYPQLELVQWTVDDISSLEKCFEGCYGAFIDSGVLPPHETPVKEWTRIELALGEKCLQAAEVSLLFQRKKKRKKKKEEDVKAEEI